MRKLILALIFSFASLPAFSAQAMWTGRSVQVNTVTNGIAWKCEYNYQGQSIWQLFSSFCPSSIEVQ